MLIVLIFTMVEAHAEHARKVYVDSSLEKGHIFERKGHIWERKGHVWERKGHIWQRKGRKRGETGYISKRDILV